MNIVEITSEENQFYPTPERIAELMLKDVDAYKVRTILEPSAGKGDLLLAFAKARYKELEGYTKEFDADVVEIDPYLREILKFRFSKENLKKEREYVSCVGYPRNREMAEKREIDIVDSVQLHVVHDNFLTYNTYKKYDLILMNPPFANGDLHLLKALEMQKDGGMVVCLLNAETILNPYTKSRQLLKQKLNELNAQIEFAEDAFSEAERKADVNVAIVRVNIPEAVYESTLFERMKKAEEASYIPDAELKAVMPTDLFGSLVCQYRAEVAATMALVKEYKALKACTLHTEPIVCLTVDREAFDVQKYMKQVRLKYWKRLFKNEKFIGRLTSNLREQFQAQISRMVDYEFSVFNIKQVMVEMNAAMSKGVQDTIMALFDKLTQEHSWYPECAKNIHYYNGWKTNKAHKIGKKSIIPIHLFSTYTWHKTFDDSRALHVLSDIEKAFDYLDGGYFKGNRYNLSSFIKHANEHGQTKNIECTYFKVDLFKKGTVHIKFKPEAMPLVERLNIYASQGKGWLPPNYGKKAYSAMDAEEKTVVDGFNGDGTDGSGEKAYTKILQEKSYYLVSPTQNLLALTE